MSYSRPQHEDVFVREYLNKQIHALTIDTEMQEKFVSYAVKEGKANTTRFKARLYHVLKGRTPSSYIALLLVDFFAKRKYENVIRTTIDYVEYITDDGNTSAFENFVKNHPLKLRITKMKFRRNRADYAIALLRTPIKPPNWDNPEDTVDKECSQKNLEFGKWLNDHLDLPISLNLSDGSTIKVTYEMDWYESKYSDEFDFEDKSNLSGTSIIRDGIDLLQCCFFKEQASCINPKYLDIYYDLHRILGGDWFKKTDQSYETKELWEKLVKHTRCLPHIFYQEKQFFPPKTTIILESFFNNLGQRHSHIAERVKSDYQKFEDSEIADKNLFLVYENARRDFSETLLPIIRTEKAQIVHAFQCIIEIYRKRAQEHFKKFQEKDKTATPNT
jgi:hypothetical protein